MLVVQDTRQVSERLLQCSPFALALTYNADRFIAEPGCEIAIGETGQLRWGLTCGDQQRTDSLPHLQRSAPLEFDSFRLNGGLSQKHQHSICSRHGLSHLGAPLRTSRDVAQIAPHRE